MLNWNANGIKNHINTLSAFLNHHINIDIACITETHLSNIDKIKFAGYNVYRANRNSLKYWGRNSPIWKKYRGCNSPICVLTFFWGRNSPNPNNKSNYNELLNANISSYDNYEEINNTSFGEGTENIIYIETILHILSNYTLVAAFPDLYQAFKALGTIPVSSESAERSFSKLILSQDDKF